MRSILMAIKKKKLLVNPKVIISNNPTAKGIKIAKNFGINTEIIDYDNNMQFESDEKIIKILKKYNIKPDNCLICLAGFMKIIGSRLIKKYKNRIINIHPSLLPSFPGLYAQKNAIINGVLYSGCTIHFVDDGIDTGPIILQDIVKVYKDDNEEKLSKRILAKEHILYPKAIKLFASNKIKIVGKKTILIKK